MKRDKDISDLRVENGRLFAEIRALRGTISAINSEIVRTKDFARQLQAAITKRNEQISLDHAYIDKLKTGKNGAYNERNRLVAALSKLFPSYLGRHPEEDRDWEDDWRWIVFIELPSGQCSWHLHDSDVHLFNHLEKHNGPNGWDGHTTEEKYDRLAKLSLSLEPKAELWDKLVRLIESDKTIEIHLSRTGRTHIWILNRKSMYGGPNGLLSEAIEMAVEVLGLSEAKHAGS